MDNQNRQIYFSPASEQHQKREKAKARELRQSQWWRQQIGQGVCYHCGGKFKPDELTMDHLIPIVRGGKSDKKNCVVSCKACNNKKGYKTRAEMAMEELACAPGVESLNKPPVDQDETQEKTLQPASEEPENSDSDEKQSK